MISKMLPKGIPLTPFLNTKKFQKVGALSVNNYKFSIVYSIRARAIKVWYACCPEEVRLLSKEVRLLSKIARVKIDKNRTKDILEEDRSEKCKSVPRSVALCQEEINFLTCPI